MNIQLISSIADELSLSKNSHESEEEMEFAVSTAFSQTELNGFIIVFDLKIEIGDKHILVVKYLSKFETDEDIVGEERNSPFLSINAPAIAYPFLRAYVANFLLSSGFDPIILPTINFVKLHESQSESTETSEDNSK